MTTKPLETWEETKKEFEKEFTLSAIGLRGGMMWRVNVEPCDIEEYLEATLAQQRKEYKEKWRDEAFMRIEKMFGDRLSKLDLEDILMILSSLQGE